ncbi:MAG: class I SAM-dependent methyltransferase [Deltaproteobacteria bacterium]|nr:class I SAM-dependent methyltransferase [Deltaproteobacteria bacterium]
MNRAQTISEQTQIRSPQALERGIYATLKNVRHGQLLITFDGATRTFGDNADLAAHVRVHDRRFFRRVALGGSLGAAESYIAGEWDCEDITALIRIFARNIDVLDGMDTGIARLALWVARRYYARQRNTRAGSKRNIHEHYDLGNDLFERMLDPTMTYSSAIFADPEMTLEQASRYKLDLLCRRLALSANDHLLEIGTGWGSMAMHAAEHYGCRVTTTTISDEQYALARERIAKAGLADRIEVVKEDYRDLRGSYDKLVSVEMIEAVGAEFYPTFFSQCANLLRPGGRMALQAITIADQHFERAKSEPDFIKRYIFPGSCIPSVTALITAATTSSDLRLRELDDYTPHYARTLAAWRENLVPHRQWIEQRYGERFWRMWHYYLGYCEGGFAEKHIGLVQMLFDRTPWRT